MNNPAQSTQDLRNALSQGIFPGFRLKQPEYSVVTPQTLAEYTIRSLVVAEEQALKGTLTSPRKLPDHLNRIIWDTLVSKPDHIKTYEDFLKNTTIKDRDALLYGLYHITYKDVSNYEIVCPQCQKKHQISFSLSSIFKMDAWPGAKNEVLTKRFEVPLSHVEPNAIFVIKQPTLVDEKRILDDMLFQSDKMLEIGMELLIVDYIKILVAGVDGSETNPNVAEIRSMDQMLKAYNGLPASERKLIQKTYIDNFAKYSVDLKVNTTCPNCGFNADMGVDLGTQFFRAIFE